MFLSLSLSLYFSHCPATLSAPRVGIWARMLYTLIKILLQVKPFCTSSWVLGHKWTRMLYTLIEFFCKEKKASRAVKLGLDIIRTARWST